ncbi:MAG: hypothetical protein JWQ88_2510 [Rhodoferax sp.]|nr:hypothetical protein [Rhodoferax sp.]
MPYPQQDALDPRDPAHSLDLGDFFGPHHCEPFGAYPRPPTVAPAAPRAAASRELFEPLPALGESTPTPRCGAFFDRAGLGWIMVCVAIAGAAGQVIPRLGEPNSWQAAGQVFEFSVAAGLFVPSDAGPQTAGAATVASGAAQDSVAAPATATAKASATQPRSAVASPLRQVDAMTAEPHARPHAARSRVREML